MSQDQELTVEVTALGPISEMAAVAAMHGAPQAIVRTPASAVAAVMAAGCVALLMLGVQPVVLGGLQAAGRLSIPEMGQAAMIETLAVGVVSAAMAARVAHRRLRLWGLAGTIMLIVANAAGLASSGLAFVLLRGVAGVASGIILWVAVGLITRRPDASRVNAIFLGSQALSQGTVAALIPLTIGPLLGANSGMWMLGGFAVLILPLLLLIPDELPDVVHDHAKVPSLHVSSLAGLASGFLMMAGIVGLWVYIEPIAAAAHIPGRVVSFAIAGSLAAQVVGALVVVAMDRWFKPVAGLLCVAAAFIGVTIVLALVRSEAAFVAATLLFGALWTFAWVLALPLVLAADPTRRAAMYGPAAGLLGCSAGPLLAGMVATDTNIAPALAMSATFFACAAVAVVVSASTRKT